MNRARLKCIRLTLGSIALALPLFLLAPSLAAVEVLEEIIEQRHALDPEATLSIHNTDGSIQIYGGACSEISIQAIKKAYTQDRLKSIVVDVSTTRKERRDRDNIPSEKKRVESE